MLHLRIFDELGSNEMDNTVVADPLYDCQKRKKYEAMVCSKCFVLQTRFFSLGEATSLGEGKL